MNRQKVRIYYALLPFAFLYGIGVRIRNKLFDLGILKSRSFPVPVICIGNLSVGGTGKTPHTEYLIRLLNEKFKIAVLSRGYKRTSKGFVLYQDRTTMADIGDEPFQMARKFPNIYVAVDRNRCHGIEQLMNISATSDAEVIILDDAYQHRYVTPGLSILLTDYNRLIFRDKLLPAGRLREPVKEKKRADIIIVTKCPDSLSKEEAKALQNRIAPLSNQKLYFTKFVYEELQPFVSGKPRLRIESLKTDESIIVVTGIASPAPLIRKLSAYTPYVYPVTFGDHHAFSATDIARIQQAFDRCKTDKRMIVTTEKDAARLTNHPNLTETLKNNLYILPIKVEFLDEDKQLFNNQIIEYVRKNPRNSKLLKK